MVELFTKKHMSEIKESNDNLDTEYYRRLQNISTRQDLKDLLHDYEEFVPYQLQKFQNMSEKEFITLMTQARQFVSDVANKTAVPEDPNEAVMLVQPPILTIIRGYAVQWNAENPGKKKMTWGSAFLSFANRGLVPKLEAMANAQMKQIIDVVNQKKEEE